MFDYPSEWVFSLSNYHYSVLLYVPEIVMENINLILPFHYSAVWSHQKSQDRSVALKTTERIERTR